ncbi:hypothetical protein D3C84_1107760 [compost metagenome]
MPARGSPATFSSTSMQSDTMDFIRNIQAAAGIPRMANATHAIGRFPLGMKPMPTYRKIDKIDAHPMVGPFPKL